MFATVVGLTKKSSGRSPNISRVRGVSTFLSVGAQDVHRWRLVDCREAGQEHPFFARA
jgi:hypothetical protein